MNLLGKRIPYPPYAVLLMLLLFLASCAGMDEQVPGGDAGVPAEAVLEAQSWLADQLNVSVEEIEIVETEQQEWPDACLGLPQGDEVCAQVITPGWRAVFNVDGQEYEVRTDETGAVIRSPEVGAE